MRRPLFFAFVREVLAVIASLFLTRGFIVGKPREQLMLVCRTVITSAPCRDMIRMCSNPLRDLTLRETLLRADAGNQKGCVHVSPRVEGNC